MLSDALPGEEASQEAELVKGPQGVKRQGMQETLSPTCAVYQGECQVNLGEYIASLTSVFQPSLYPCLFPCSFAVDG